MLAGLGGTLQEANRLSQNKMAFQLRAAEQDQMRKDISSPTQFSITSVLYKKAEKSAAVLGGPAEEGAAVYMVDKFARQGIERVGPDEYLGVQVLGGQTAGPRKSEKALQIAGIIPPGKVWVPAKNVKLNSYGNVDGGVIARILMDLKLGFVETKTKNFALFGPKGNPTGVLAKIGDSWYPYLYFVDRAAYQPRYDFYGRADRDVAEKWKGIWDFYAQKALEKAAK